MGIVTSEIRDNICIITVNNPPVNAISQAVRQGIIDEVSASQNNASIKAIVLHCAGRTFMAGADIKEFGKPSLEPILPTVISKIENSNVPIIAAIHGHALGGGFEISLGCHYRVADKAAKVGLPEVKLGIIPGAGGTQRLPRLVDVEEALAMASSGDPVDANKALSIGILDEISTETLLDDAINFATKIAPEKFNHRRLSQQPVINTNAIDLNKWRENLAKRQRSIKAAQVAVDAVEAAMTLTFDKGSKKERALFNELRQSGQAAAMRHLFFAERQSTQTPQVNRDTAQKPVSTVGIIGAGTMGTGIAMAFLNAGLKVVLLEVSDPALEHGIGTISKTYEASVKRGKMNAGQAAECQALLTPTTNNNDLADCDLVIEAVFEDLNIKKQVFEKLNTVCRPDAILATNTSYLDLNEIASFVKNPENFIGLHFFSPANIMKLLEIITTESTSPETLNTVIKLSKKLGKTGVIARPSFGFIGNRIYQAYQREAGFLLLEGAAPRQIDNALYNFGMPMGPFAVADLTGLDIGYLMRQSVSNEFFEARAFQVHDQLVEAGRKGQKTGAGFYLYQEGSRTPKDDDHVNKLISEIATKEGITQRVVTDDEIRERCLYGMINEGARLLDEKVALRASDIDVVFANGYGFPRYQGGPMFYATQIGLDKVLKKINQWSETSGTRWWAPSPSLVLAAEQNRWGG